MLRYCLLVLVCLAVIAIVGNNRYIVIKSPSIAGINTVDIPKELMSQTIISSITISELVYKIAKEEGLTDYFASLFQKIAKAESTNNPRAIGYASTANVQFLGLFQIAYPMTWDYADCTGDIYNPVDNTRCAIKIYRIQGLGAWEVVTKNVVY